MPAPPGSTTVNWTPTQKERLEELEAAAGDLERSFSDTAERNRVFQELERRLVAEARECLRDYRENLRRPAWCRLESRLVNRLVDEGFVQVATPTIMAAGHLRRMGIDESHPLASQVFWLDGGRCLRPMLAPHLYFVLKDLLRIWEHPVRIFEVGSCFRKESKGSQHANEFTMLNIVSMGLPMEERRPLLNRLTDMVMAEAGIEDFRIESTSSEVYGETIDIVGGPEDIELGSSAMGPHPLDDAWRIRTTWVGVGFGLERLVMAAGQKRSLGRLGRNLAYLDGVSLSL
ncbi:MAG: pyrrolysine--tRNA(Pyl) ligase large subunit [Desulfobacterales bacterium]